MRWVLISGLAALAANQLASLARRVSRERVIQVACVHSVLFSVAAAEQLSLTFV